MNQELRDDVMQQFVQQVNNLARGFMGSQVLFEANEAGFFALLEQACSVEDVAKETGLNAHALRILLDGMHALGLVTKVDGLYVNAPMASACLVPGRPGYQGHIVQHMKHVSQSWARLSESLRSGTGVSREEAERSPEELRAFILGMNDIAKFSAKELLTVLDLSAYQHMLDLGGGPATYPIAFLQAHPAMRATVFDFAPVVEIGQEQVAKAGLRERVNFIAGDMTKDDFGSGYDLILISNIIHSFGPEMNREIVRKCYRALESGGMLIIKDFLVDNDRSGPAFGLMFAINMLVNTPEGDTYTYAEVRDWTDQAGFVSGHAIDLTPQTRLWTCEKP